MAEKKKLKWEFSLPWFLFILSLVINLFLLTAYFFKILPYQNSLKRKINGFSQNETCTRVYSQNAGKVVCLSKEELKADSLSECSKNFRENLNSDVLKGLRDLDDLEKLRGLSIKMCMQEKGYEYK